MKDLKVFLRLTIVIFFLPLICFSQIADMPVKWLSFEEININEELHFRTIEDRITNHLDTIIGNYIAPKGGVYGKSLLLDGYSAYVFSKNVPSLSGSFKSVIGVARRSTSSTSFTIRSSISRKDIWQPAHPASQSLATVGFAMIYS